MFRKVLYIVVKILKHVFLLCPIAPRTWNTQLPKAITEASLSKNNLVEIKHFIKKFLIG